MKLAEIVLFHFFLSLSPKDQANSKKGISLTESALSF